MVVLVEAALVPVVLVDVGATSTVRAPPVVTAVVLPSAVVAAPLVSEYVGFATHAAIKRRTQKGRPSIIMVLLRRVPAMRPRRV